MFPPEADGARYRAQIVGIDRDFKHPKYSSEQHIKFRLKTNDDEFDEHIAHTKMLSFIEDNFLQPQDGLYWTMRRIIAHSRLHDDDPRRYYPNGRLRFNKTCKQIILVEWEDGQRSWEDPRLFDGDSHEITVAVQLLHCTLCGC